ncbi:MAG: hypothetical protein ABL971_10350 [Vicinamibacterales bacterium]
MTSLFGRLLFRDVVFWLSLGLTMIAVAVPPLRYSIYVVPFLVVLALLGDGDFRIGDELKPFLIFICAGLVMAPMATAEGMKDVFFTTAGVSIALLITTPAMKTRRLFVCTLATGLIYFTFSGGLNQSVSLDVVNSTSPFESNFGFLFGLLAVFALIGNDKWLFGICLALSILGLKRIAVLAALVAALFWLIGERRGKWILNPPVMILANISVAGIAVMYGGGLLDGPIRQLTGQSANQLGQGRQALLSVPAREMMRRPLEFALIGAGPGSTYELSRAGTSEFSGRINLHSDILKVLYEYGLLVFLLFIASMYRSSRYEMRVAFLFLNVLFVTDNTLIYASVLFVFMVGARLMSDPPPSSLAGSMSSTRWR